MSSASSSSSAAASNSGSAARMGLCVFATLYTFFFVGALFGWGPMQRMLEASGAFDDLCNSDDTSTLPCPKMSTRIIQINFVATTTNTLTPFMGQAIDIWGGPKVATWFMSPCAILGAGVVAYAAYENRSSMDILYFVGFSFLGLATFCGSLLNVQVGLYFGGTLQVRVIMFLNALFDAGSVTYLLLWYMMEALNVQFDTICLVYFGLAVFCYGGGMIFWNIAQPTDPFEEDAKESTVDEHSPMLLEVTDGEAALMHINAHQQTPRNSSARRQVAESLREFQAAHMDNAEEIRQTMSSYRGGASGSLRESTGYGTSTPGNKKTDDYVLLADRSPKDQILSIPYILLTLFFSINMISCNWTLATAADFLYSLGDDSGKYLSLFTIMQPASIFALPLVDYTVQTFGFGAAFQCVNGLTFLYIGIKLFSDNLNVQIITFVMVAMVRCYLYAVTFSFLPRLLSADAVGKGTGFLYMVGGVASCLNIPLNNTVLQTGFFPPNMLYWLLTIPTTYMAWVVERTIHKEDAAKAQQQLMK